MFLILKNVCFRPRLCYFYRLRYGIGGETYSKTESMITVFDYTSCSRAKAIILFSANRIYGTIHISRRFYPFVRKRIKHCWSPELRLRCQKNSVYHFACQHKISSVCILKRMGESVYWNRNLEKYVFVNDRRNLQIHSASILIKILSIFDIFVPRGRNVLYNELLNKKLQLLTLF